MQINRGRRSFTLVLVFVATVFGMILAGGATLAPVSNADTGQIKHAVSVVPSTGGLPSFADLAEAVSPAVVSIQATKIESGGSRGRGADPFEFFFGPRRRQPQEQQREPEDRRSDSAGSGFVISADGLIVTNHHVIEDATGLEVVMGDRQYAAEVVGDDPATDIALLKIEPESELDYLDLADSEALRVGDWIMVIGSPLQLENSVSVGVVSAKGRAINITPDRSLENFIQTDAAINFGNSGGPLVNLSGAVVGIATAINFGAENIGFAVPVNTLKTILPQLRDSGSVKRGYLGVNIEDLDFDRAEAWGLDSPNGALVTDVIEDSPSEKAGVRHGDVILEVDGRKIRDNRQLIDYISSQPPDQKVELGIWRNGEMISREVVLGERRLEGQAAPSPEEEEESGEIEWLGIEYQELTPSLRETHSIPDEVEGVWITDVAATSPLFDENVRPNDFIVEVNGASIETAAELESAIGGVESGKLLRLYVKRIIDVRSGNVASFFAVVRKP
ncbi:MAG: Do family serine endopeptidase [bacterium]|nr:Do family serine endopeptidase [bacterium]